LNKRHIDWSDYINLRPNHCQNYFKLSIRKYYSAKLFWSDQLAISKNDENVLNQQEKIIAMNLGAATMRSFLITCQYFSYLCMFQRSLYRFVAVFFLVHSLW